MKARAAHPQRVPWRRWLTVVAWRWQATSVRHEPGSIDARPATLTIAARHGDGLPLIRGGDGRRLIRLVKRGLGIKEGEHLLGSLDGRPCNDRGGRHPRSSKGRERDNLAAYAQAASAAVARGGRPVEESSELSDPMAKEVRPHGEGGVKGTPAQQRSRRKALVDGEGRRDPRRAGLGGRRGRDGRRREGLLLYIYTNLI